MAHLQRFASLTASAAVLLTACGSSPSKPPHAVFNHQELHDPLLTIRGAQRVCHSKSKDCQQWTVLMLNCEQGTADSCQEAEDLRQQASGVASESEPKAYEF